MEAAGWPVAVGRRPGPLVEEWTTCRLRLDCHWLQPCSVATGQQAGQSIRFRRWM
jgi:hypothetical protein